MPEVNPLSRPLNLELGEDAIPHAGNHQVVMQKAGDWYTAVLAVVISWYSSDRSTSATDQQEGGLQTVNRHLATS